VETGLNGKIVLITGAGRGIGAACARAFAAEGAWLVLADLDGSAVRAVSHEVGAHALTADVGQAAEATRIVNDVRVRFKRLDVLVTCAGVFQGTALDRITADEWDRVLAVNLRGTFLVAQAALELMVPQGSGRIVTIGSLSAQSGGLAAGAAYAASKAGVAALTKSIARWAAPHGITANCVQPGVVDTAITQAWPRDVLARTVAATPLARTATADEIAAAVLYLASDAAAFVTGTHVDVNGGLYMA
jgi:3-oxoacyl-[acyl-carrier protein] reductase